ncbi:MAG: lipopolysaccharide assembly protein LapA domain-containing protein [Acidobacteria bacterium]|nr:lipopolysaccharide assembly protein LapA domain-containing protein [Acidobacteriota bacterium]
MRLRHVGVLFLLLLLAIFAVANWGTIEAPTRLNLLVGQVEAPLGLLMLISIGFLTVLYALLLVVVERRLLREGARLNREIEEERKRRNETQTTEIRQLAQTMTHDLSEVRGILGRLVSQITELRSLVAGRVSPGTSGAPADEEQGRHAAHAERGNRQLHWT